MPMGAFLGLCGGGGGAAADDSVWHQAAMAGSLAQLKAAHAEAVATHSEGRMQKLLEQGSRRGGATPLMLASSRGNAACVTFLLETAGANPFTADRAGNTALHHAARNGHAECIDAIMNGVPESQIHQNHFRLQDTPNTCGLTPLHLAVAYNHLEATEALLDRDPYLMSRTKAFSQEKDLNIVPGSTPLHLAAIRGSLPLVRALLKHNFVRKSGPDVIRLVKDSSGLNPHQEAIKHGHGAAGVGARDGSDSSLRTKRRPLAPLHESASEGNGSALPTSQQVQQDPAYAHMSAPMAAASQDAMFLRKSVPMAGPLHLPEASAFARLSAKSVNGDDDLLKWLDPCTDLGVAFNMRPLEKMVAVPEADENRLSSMVRQNEI